MRRRKQSSTWRKIAVLSARAWRHYWHINQRDANGLRRPAKYSTALYRLRFWASVLSYPMRRLLGRLRRDSYMLATLSSVNIEFMASMPGMNNELLGAYKPPQRKMDYARLKGLKQLHIRTAADFLDGFRYSRMLIVDITPTLFSGATMDSRIALLVGMAVAKNIPVYYIRAESILPFIERQRALMSIPHKSQLVKNPESIDFSNLADLMEEC